MITVILLVSLILKAVFIRPSGSFTSGHVHDHPHRELDYVYEGNMQSPAACSSLQLRRCGLAFPFIAFPWASCTFVVEKIECLIRKGCTEVNGLDQWMKFHRRMCKNSPIELPESFKRMMALTARSRASTPVTSWIVFLLGVVMTTVG